MSTSVTVGVDHPAFPAVLALLSGASPVAISTATAPVGATPMPAATIAPPSPMVPPTAPAADDDNGPVNASAPAVDATGLPWDERIHAGTKNTNADGSWKKKRGAPEALVTAVEAELRARVAGVPPMPATTMPAPSAPPVAAPAMPAPVAQPAPVPTPTPAPAPVAAPVERGPSPDPTAPGFDFDAFMAHIQTLVQTRNAAGAPMVDAEYFAQLVQTINTNAKASNPAHVDLTAITDLAQQPHLVSYAAQLMQHAERW